VVYIKGFLLDDYNKVKSKGITSDNKGHDDDRVMHHLERFFSISEIQGCLSNVSK